MELADDGTYGILLEKECISVKDRVLRRHQCGWLQKKDSDWAYLFDLLDVDEDVNGKHDAAMVVRGRIVDLEMDIWQYGRRHNEWKNGRLVYMGHLAWECETRPAVAVSSSSSV